MNAYLQQGKKVLDERLLFLKEFLDSPRHMGSITPSSSYLVRALIDLADVAAATEIVELGPGTGPFTAGLLERMAPNGRLMCIERDPALAEHLRSRFHDRRLIVITGDARGLSQHLKDHGFHERVALIVSGLPFTSLPEDAREEILEAIKASLWPDGYFLLYQYSYAMRGRLRHYFRSVEPVWELRNLPPAVCMRCRI